MSEKYASGYVAIVGAPNVGKSTLLNRLLDQKIAIVSPKPQTTRTRILGILTRDRFQMVLVDTPGIFQPGYALQKAMVQTATLSLSQADVALVLVEGTQPAGPDEERIVDLVKKSPSRSVLAINKVDLVRDKKFLLPLMADYHRRRIFAEIVPISALTGDGVEDLVSALAALLPPGPQLYPEEMITESPQRFLAAEIIREKIFLRTGEEIPYSVAVLVDEHQDRGRVLYIKATIYVEKDSQKAIVIGEQGHKIKEIGRLAREELESGAGKKVFLELWVKVRRQWRHRDPDLRFFGYNSPKR